MRLVLDLLALVRALSEDRARLALENVVLRQQLNALRRYRSALIVSDPPPTPRRLLNDHIEASTPVTFMRYRRCSGQIGVAIGFLGGTTWDI